MYAPRATHNSIATSLLFAKRLWTIGKKQRIRGREWKTWNRNIKLVKIKLELIYFLYIKFDRNNELISGFSTNIFFFQLIKSRESEQKSHEINWNFNNFQSNIRDKIYFSQMIFQLRVFIILFADTSENRRPGLRSVGTWNSEWSVRALIN